jgi:hypothetical protein
MGKKRSEGKKQVLDQFAHALWGIATGIVAFAAGLLGKKWLIGGILIAIGSIAGWVAREWWQIVDPKHPGSHVWWDPYLDSGVFAVAVLGGVLLGIYVIRRRS